MRTDLKKLLANIGAGIESLTTDAEELGKAEAKDKDESTELHRKQQLLGVAITNLRGAGRITEMLVKATAKAEPKAEAPAKA